MVKISKFDAADYLDHQETIAIYLSEALQTGDSEYICHALNTVARAKDMNDVAKEALSGNSKPKFDTVRKAIESFGLKLIVEPVEEDKRS
jgi:probable addiction module antidote protein